MKAGLDKKLCSKYPKIFAQRHLPMTETAMCWGFDHQDGWYWLVDNLCDSIQRYVDNRNEGVRIRNKAREEGKEVYSDSDQPWKKEEEWEVEATQVKEKFGGLRFYISGGDDYIYGMIDFAEHLSYKICEKCGSTENVEQTKGGWIATLCSKCMEEAYQ